MDDPHLFDELSEKLRAAHVQVAGLPLSPEEKSSITRRLLAISNTSKHDLARAAQRLDAFLGELDSQYPRP